MSLVYGPPKDCFEDGFIIGTECDVMMKKSKLSPKIVEIPCYISVKDGGKIDEVASFMKYIQKPNIGIVKTGSWYNMNDTIDKLIEKYPNLDKSVESYKGNIRRLDLEKKIKDDKELAILLQIALIDFIDGIYPLQRNINDAYQRKLMSDSVYFKEECKGDDNDK